MKNGQKTFMKITNLDIFNKLKEHDTKFEQITTHLARINGSLHSHDKDIKFSKKVIWWMIGTGLTLFLFVITQMFNVI